MSKGPSGSTTTSTVSPASTAQLPYSQNLWSTAQNEFDNPQNYGNVSNAYQNIENLAPQIAGVGNTGANLFTNAANGAFGVGNSPAASSIDQLIGGYSTPEIGLNNAVAGTGNPGMNALSATANGAYLNPNPYIAGEFGAAAQPVVNSYMTATAPQTTSGFEGAGRYGSGAASNAQGQNELNLGTTLGNLASNLYGADYANERGLQNSAASTEAGLGESAAGALTNAGAEGTSLLQGGYQAGNTATLQDLAMLPQIQGGILTPQQDVASAATSEAQLPYDLLSQFANLIGQPIYGSTSTSQPYFNNTGSNALGASLGLLGLFASPFTGGASAAPIYGP